MEHHGVTFRCFISHWFLQCLLSRSSCERLVERPALRVTTLGFCADALSMDQIKNMEISSLDLLKSLPDLFWDLNELGIGTHLSRGNVTREYTQYLTVASSSAGTDSAQSAPLGPQAQVAGFT